MKKSFMTRILATGLSFAMAFSMAAVTSVTPASAASKPVLVDAVTGGSGKAVTVNVDEVAKLKVNAATKKTYAVSSVKKSSKKIKTAVNKKGTVVYVRGVAETGEKDSAIRVSFKVKKTGKISKFTFASKVKVVSPKPANVKLTGATQKEATKIAVTFDNAAITPGAISSFKVARTEGNIVVPVKAVVYDADKKGATLETYVGMTDAKEYTVTYTDADEAKTVSTATFTATDNKIADLQVSTTSLVAKETTEVKIKTLDAQGVLLNEYSLTKAEQNKITFDLKSSDGTAYRAGDGIYVAKVGDTVTLKATLHTYKYVDGKEQDIIEREFTLVGTTEDYAAISFGYSIASKKPDFNSSSYKQNKAVAKGAESTFFPNFKKGSNDVEKKFAIESSDPSVLLVANAEVGKLTKDGVKVKGVKEGTAYILVKDADKALVASLEVTVGAASAANTITLSSNSVVTSDSGAETKEVTVKVKDQYDNELPIEELKVECTDTTAKSAAAITKKKDGTTNTIVIDGKQDKAGKTVSYSYKVTAKTKDGKGTKEAYLSVTINHAGTIADVTNYGLVLDKEDIDLAWSKDATNTGSALKIQVAAYDKNGGLVDFLPLAKSGVAITVKKSNDATKELKVESGAAALSGKNDVADVILSASSAGAVTGTNKDPIKKYAEVGTYTVTATFDVAGKANTFSKQFNVKDTQGTFTFKVADTSKDKWSTDAKTTLTPTKTNSNVTYYINNNAIDSDDVKVEEVKSTTLDGAAAISVSKVVIAYRIDGNKKDNWVYVDAVPADNASAIVLYTK